MSHSLEVGAVSYQIKITVFSDRVMSDRLSQTELSSPGSAALSQTLS